MHRMPRSTQEGHKSEAFPIVTLRSLELGSLLDSSLLRFLKDRRVTFFPFAGADSDEQVVIDVRLDRGFLVEAGHLLRRRASLRSCHRDRN
jgi:hypothetical protein